MTMARVWAGASDHILNRKLTERERERERERELVGVRLQIL
jgi:hypothetical protein